MSVLTVADLKAHMNIIGDDDDALIAKKIEAAEQWVGAYVGRCIDELWGPPEPLLEAVRQLVAHLYENREASIVGVSMSDVSPGIFDLMRPYREYVF